MGVQVPDAPMETDAKEASPAKAAKKYFIDSIFIHRPREGVEMKNPMRDCMSKPHCPHFVCVRFVLAQKAITEIGLMRCQVVSVLKLYAEISNYSWWDDWVMSKVPLFIG